MSPEILAHLPQRLLELATDPERGTIVRRESGPVGAIYVMTIEGVDDAMLATTNGRPDAWAWSLHGRFIDAQTFGNTKPMPKIGGVEQARIVSGPLAGCALLRGQGGLLVVQSPTFRDAMEGP